jgi:DNA-binding GntR family transcriptional regulator
VDATISMTEPVAPQVVRRLKQAIVEMRMKPGEALSEKEVAGLFGVSRQPVREAFIKLAESGLLRVLPSRGTYVMKISVREVANARFVREAVEGAIARAAGELAKPADIADLRVMLVRQREAAAANDNRLFLEHDEAFHRRLAEIADCTYAWRVVEEARAQMDRVRYLSLPDASPMPLLIDQHESIVAGIAASSPDAAEAAMRKHLREILIALPRLAARYPDLFEDEGVPAHTTALLERGRVSPQSD